MKENKYDNNEFFEKYSQFPRSVDGLKAAGEWHELQRMLPDFRGKCVLDLGCGFGWHSRYAIEQGAESVVGVDISGKMLAEAAKKTNSNNITYICSSIEDYEYPKEAFDMVISSLVLHYIESFGDVCAKVRECLRIGGDFVFSVEHPIFTAQGKQEWVLNESGELLHWPVDNYFFEGVRNTRFLGEDVLKYHKTLTTYVGDLIDHGFIITGVCEPIPTQEMLAEMPNELRRPMMLIISAKKI